MLEVASSNNGNEGETGSTLEDGEVQEVDD